MSKKTLLDELTEELNQAKSTRQECDDELSKRIHDEKRSRGWISVDDELPIDEGFVLLLKDDGDIVIGQYVFDTSPFFATTEFYQNQDYDWIADLNNVTHWQEIIPPNEENDK